jgi:hypothetical protein
MSGINSGEEDSRMAGLRLAVDLYNSEDELAKELLTAMLALDPWLVKQFQGLKLEVV